MAIYRFRNLANRGNLCGLYLIAIQGTIRTHPSFDSCSRNVIGDDRIHTHRVVADANGDDLALTVTATDYVIVEKNPSLYR